MPTENRPRKQQTKAPSSRRRKPASLPAIAAATATRNQQDDDNVDRSHGAAPAATRPPSTATTTLPPHSPLRTSSASSSNRSDRGAPLQLLRDAMFADFACSQLRRHVNLSGWAVADATLQLLRTVSSSNSRKPLEKLEKLTLDGCERVTVAGGLSSLSAASCHALTSVSLERCQALSAASVAYLPTTLVELRLAYCEWVDDEVVRALARHCVTIVSVSLRHCRRVTDYGVAAFGDATSSKPALTSLDISYCSHVTDVGVLALVTKATRLRVLRAAALPLLEGVNLEGLARISSSCLELLDVSNCTRLRASALCHVVHTVAHARLTDLTLRGSALVTDDVLAALGRCCPLLRVLRLAACARVSDAGVQRLVAFVPSASEHAADFDVSDNCAAPRCVQLQTLEFAGCFLLTDAALFAVGAACTDLEVLLLDGVRRITNVGLRAVTANCARLHTLGWSGTLVRSTAAANGDSGTTAGFFSIPRLDRTALSAVNNAAQLRTLHIGSTQCDADALCLLLARVGLHLLDLDVTAIATDTICERIGSACRSLRVLCLSRSRYFTERSFLCVARGCTELRALDLESCEQIRDAGVVALSQHCVSLERLVLANDWQVTDASIALLGARCPQLLVLNVRHCPEVTLPTLRSLAKRNNCVDVSRDGLTSKHANVVKWLRRDGNKRAAAHRITRWLKQRLRARDHSQHALEHALQCIRRRKRCAVRIQRCIRRFLVQRRQQALVEQVKHERDDRVAAAWQTIRDYCVVCCHVRAFVRRQLAARRLRLLREAERVRIEREQAAVAIQRIVRGFLGRRRARAARIAAALERERRTAAATAIQRVVRGHWSRTSTAVRDACSARELLVFTAILHCEQRECAALQLQRVARGFVGRRRSRHRAAVVLKQQQRRNRAVHSIQRSYRAYLARVQLQRFLFRTATQLQRVVRGHGGRRDARAIVLERSYTSPPCLLLLLPRSIFTRAFALQWKRKRDAALVVATNAQRLYRGYVGRVRYRVVRALARQLCFTLDRSARLLQHFFRSIVILARLARFQAHLHLRHCSATTIQATWRMWLGKVRALALSLRADRMRRHAALLALLRDAPRDARAKLHFLQLGAAYTLVRTYRASLVARGWQPPSYVQRLHRSATCIQAVVRGHFGRRFVCWYRAALLNAVLVVQRVWRGREGRRIWRQLVTERAQRLREQDEDDRAARVSRKLSSQYALDAYARASRHARVLQSWYRTLHNRQVFRQARAMRMQQLEKRAAERLATMLARSTDSVVFQAHVWRDCMAQKTALLEMDDASCLALETEIAELRTECCDAHVAAAHAAAEHAVVATHMRDTARAKRQLASAAAQLKTRVKPFAVQAKALTKQSARVHVRNNQLQRELRTLEQGVAALHSHLHAVLPLEPLLLAGDVAHLLGFLELPDGRESLVADEFAALEQQYDQQYDQYELQYEQYDQQYGQYEQYEQQYEQYENSEVDVVGDGGLGQTSAEPS